jgi:hypothetical protein
MRTAHYISDIQPLEGSVFPSGSHRFDWASRRQDLIELSRHPFCFFIAGFCRNLRHRLIKKAYQPYSHSGRIFDCGQGLLLAHSSILSISPSLCSTCAGLSASARIAAINEFSGKPAHSLRVKDKIFNGNRRNIHLVRFGLISRRKADVA